MYIPGQNKPYRHTALSKISNRIVGKKYYNALFNITQCLASDVGFTNIVVQSTGQSGAKTKYGVPTVRGNCYIERNRDHVGLT